MLSLDIIKKTVKTREFLSGLCIGTIFGFTTFLLTKYDLVTYTMSYYKLKRQNKSIQFDASQNEQKICLEVLSSAGAIIKNASCGIITTINSEIDDISSDNSLTSRAFENVFPFDPQLKYVYMGTNSFTRKCKDLKQNSNITLSYTDYGLSYVSLSGRAEIVDHDEAMKLFPTHWKPFFVGDLNRNTDFLLYRIKITKIELASGRFNLMSKRKDWCPFVLLRQNDRWKLKVNASMQNHGLH